jgi:hypothetical protein
MEQKKVEATLKTAAEISPIVIAAGVAAVAGVGYFLWTKRSKIQKFLKEQNLGETFDHVTDLVSEGASKMNGLLKHEVKPMTNSIHSGLEKVAQAVK